MKVRYVVAMEEQEEFVCKETSSQSDRQTGSQAVRSIRVVVQFKILWAVCPIGRNGLETHKGRGGNTSER
jgi:hypothetical protein